MDASVEKRPPVPAAPNGATPPRTRLWRIALLALGPILIAGLVAWQTGVFAAMQRPHPPANELMVIAPYRYQGTWVFDDARAGLVKEPFVAGIPEMIDVLVEDVPNAENGFRMLFSAKPFPGYQKKLTWLREASGGNYYALEEPPMEGWICPAMFKYYAEAPKELYVKAEPIL
jgi:hypothetical protein